jgi:hypothetical protein
MKVIYSASSSIPQFRFPIRALLSRSPHMRGIVREQTGQEIDTALSEITVHGGRMNEQQMKAVDQRT